MAAITTDSILFYTISFLVLLIISKLIFTLKSFSFGTPFSNSGLKHRSLPSPPALPIIGHLHLIGPLMHKCFQNLARLYGPILQLRFGASTGVLVSNFHVAKQIFKTHELNFLDRPQFGSNDYFPYKGSYFVSAPYGPYWRFMKKLCVTQLLSTSQLGCFTHIRELEIKNLLDSLLLCSSEGKSCDLTLKFTALTNNILCRMAMSTTCDAEQIHRMSQELVEVAGKLSVGEVLGPLGKLDLFGYGKKLAKIVGKFDNIMEAIMKEHEKEQSCTEGGERRDMMDILLQVYRDPNAEMKLTRNDIKLFFLLQTLLQFYLQWAMAEILNHPKVLDKLRTEINSVVGTSRLVRESDVPNLPYLRAVVKEVLRLHPSATFVLRQSVEDCNIDGYDLKGHTRTIINVYAIMRDPEAWMNPEEFIPERFLDEINGGEESQYLMDMKGQDVRYVPFGSGRRGCPGASLALAVVHSTLGALIQCFDWKVKGGDKVNMEEGSGFTVPLAKPLVCYPITRHNLL